MEVICSHCGYEWDYKGKKKLTNCPDCGYKVFLHKARRIFLEKYGEEKKEVDEEIPAEV